MREDVEGLPPGRRVSASRRRVRSTVAHEQAAAPVDVRHRGDVAAASVLLLEDLARGGVEDTVTVPVAQGSSQHEYPTYLPTVGMPGAADPREPRRRDASWRAVASPVAVSTNLTHPVFASSSQR